MLSDFFRINLPYGIAKNNLDEWFAFNREYMPLGFNNTTFKSRFPINETSDLPIHTKYKNIKEDTLIKLADDDTSIQRDSKGKICTVFFYDDGSNPSNNPQGWDKYLQKIKVVSGFKVAAPGL